MWALKFLAFELGLYVYFVSCTCKYWWFVFTWSYFGDGLFSLDIMVGLDCFEGF